MSFIAPENQGFVAPENQAASPQGFVAPENQGPAMPEGGYNAPGVQDATVDDVGTLMLAKDAAKLGYVVARDPAAALKAVKNLPTTLKDAAEAVKEFAGKLFTKAAPDAAVGGAFDPGGAGVMRPMADVAPTPNAPSAPLTQGELPLANEAHQQLLKAVTDPLPGPVQTGVDRIAAELGKKYGGVSKHMGSEITGAAQLYAEDPKLAEQYLSDRLPHLVRGPGVEVMPGKMTPANILGELDPSGKSMPFPTLDVANQFKAELLAKLQAHPLLQRDIGTQLGLFAPREGAQNLIEGPKPIQGEGFTMSHSPTPPASPPTGIETGTPTAPFQVPPQSGPAPTQPDLFNLDRFGGKIAETPQAKLAAAIQAKDLPSPLPPGATQRLAGLATKAGAKQLNDIPANGTGIMARVDLNKAVEGTPSGILAEQRSVAVTASNNVDKQFAEEFGKFKDSLPFKAGSPEDKAMKFYGEAADKAKAEQAIRDIHGDKTPAIIKAANDARTLYDANWVATNKALVASGRPAIPYRNDYFTHGNDLSLLDQLGMLFKGSATDQADTLSRFQTADKLVQQGGWSKLTDILFPFTKRTNAEDTLGGIEGVRRYIFAAKRVQNMQPVMNEMNETARVLQGNYPGVAKYIQDQANHLGGQKAGADIVAEDWIKPWLLKGTKALNRNYMASAVEGNVHVPFMHALTDSINFAQNPVKQFMAAGWDVVASPDMRAFALENSPTIQSRLASYDARTVDAKLIRKSITGAMTWMDKEIGTHVFLTKFKTAVAAGQDVPTAITAADSYLAGIWGSSSPIDTPPMLRASILQNLVPFQNRAVAYAKSVMHLWDGQTVSQKALTTMKYALSTYAAAQAEHAVFGRSSGVVGRALPFGESLARGIGGPMAEQAGNAIKAADNGDAKTVLKNFAHTAFMVQPVIPAAGQVWNAGRALYNHFANGTGE